MAYRIFRKFLWNCTWYGCVLRVKKWQNWTFWKKSHFGEKKSKILQTFFRVDKKLKFIDVWFFGFTLFTITAFMILKKLLQVLEKSGSRFISHNGLSQTVSDSVKIYLRYKVLFMHVLRYSWKLQFDHIFFWMWLGMPGHSESALK